MSKLLAGEVPIDRFVRRNAYAFSRDLIKEPVLTFVAPDLLAYFPAAKSIFVVRDPWHNIRSILNRLRTPGDLKAFDGLSEELQDPTWDAIIRGRDLGLDGRHYIEVLAMRWCRGVDVFLDDPASYVLCRYEDFCDDKIGQVDRLASAVGWTPTSDITDSLDTDFQPRGRRGTDPREFFGPNFGVIESICASRVTTLGYRTPADRVEG